MNKLLYEKESYQIRGACFAVWKRFGNIHRENIVEKALAEEFQERNLAFERQKQIAIFYKEKQVGYYKPDFVIENKIILEIKSKPRLLDHDLKQFWQYLRGTKFKLGFLVNFGSDRLKIIRRIYETARDKKAGDQSE